MYCTCATSQKGKECECERTEEVEREAGSRDEMELG